MLTKLQVCNKHPCTPHAQARASIAHLRDNVPRPVLQALEQALALHQEVAQGVVSVLCLARHPMQVVLHRCLQARR